MRVVSIGGEFLDASRKVLSFFDDNHRFFGHHRKTFGIGNNLFYGYIPSIQDHLVEPLFLFSQNIVFDVSGNFIDVIGLFTHQKVNGFGFPIFDGCNNFIYLVHLFVLAFKGLSLEKMVRKMHVHKPIASVEKFLVLCYD